jgi:catabolite regulation protein CreA
VHDVQDKINVLRAACFLQHELHGLCSRNYKVFRSRSEGSQQFENVGPLGFRNQGVLQLGSIVFSRRYSACFKSLPPRA